MRQLVVAVPCVFLWLLNVTCCKVLAHATNLHCICLLMRASCRALTCNVDILPLVFRLPTSQRLVQLHSVWGTKPATNKHFAKQLPNQESRDKLLIMHTAVIIQRKEQEPHMPCPSCTAQHIHHRTRMAPSGSLPAACHALHLPTANKSRVFQRACTHGKIPVLCNLAIESYLMSLPGSNLLKCR
jgi:hypothetical protein